MATSSAAVVVARGYVDGPYGQVHYALASPAGAIAAPPLVFFHQNPRSWRDNAALMQRLATDRVCVALDTPGYGNSDPPPAPPGLAGYCDALLTALRGLDLVDGAAPVDAFGFHTGAHLAIECALQAPGSFRRLALGGVPYMVGAERQRWLEERVTKRTPRPLSGSHLIEAWHRFVTNRPAGMSVERGEQLALEYVSTGDRAWWAYDGVFRYEAEKRLPLVTQPALLIAVNDMLVEHTRAAARVMPTAQLVEAPQMQGGVILDEHADELAAIVRRFLA